MLNRLLFRPYEFFYHLREREADIKTPLLLLLMTSLLTTLSSFSIYSDVNYIYVLIATVFIALFLWFYLWLPLRLFSKIKERLWEIAAWNAFPLFFLALINTVISLLFPHPGISMQDVLQAQPVQIDLNSTNITLSRIVNYTGAAWSAFFIYNTVLGFSDNKTAARNTTIGFGVIWLLMLFISL